MIRWLALAGLFVANCCFARSLAWKAPVFFDDFPDYSGSPGALDPAFDRASSRMLFSEAGAAGWIAAGTLEAEDLSLPAVVKLSGVDGHTQWRWIWSGPGADRDMDTGENRIVNAAVDVAGQVFVTGWMRTDDAVHSFFVKLDGASGAERWRIYGDAHTRGYAIAADTGGNIITGAVRLSGFGNAPAHVIEKRRGDTGALIWSTALPGGTDEFDDLRVVLDAEGNAIMTGRYDLPDQSGVRVVKLRAGDGSVVWTHLSIVPETYFGGAESLQRIGFGDVLARVPEGLVYLNADGSQRWLREVTYDFQPRNFATDRQGRIYYADSPSNGQSGSTATFGCIDPATGADLWQTRPYDGPHNSSGQKIGVGEGGTVIAVWTINDIPSLPLRASVLDPSSGQAGWTVAFGGIDPDIYGAAYGVVQDDDGSVFVGANGDRGDNPLTSETWTLYKITGPFSDDIFANGWDG